METRLSQVIDDDWLRVDAVSVGRVRPGLGTPDRYVTLSDGEVPILRVDVYADPQDCSPFEDALVWRGNLVIGFGRHVHVVAIAERTSCTVALDSYYGHLYPTPDYVLIASGCRLLRMEPDLSILWETEMLAIDGVVVESASPAVIRGNAEHDPPSGWRPFAISAVNGATWVDENAAT